MIDTFHTQDFSNGNPKNIVFILHGYGADGENLASLSPYFAPHIEKPVFIVPNAPFPYEHMPQMGRQWFSLADRNEQKMLQGAEIARQILVKFIESQLLKHDLEWQNVILIGFSQGCMMSIFTALKLPQCKGVVGFSGTMISQSETIANVKFKPKVCIIHGQNDDIVECTRGKLTAKILQNLGVECEFHQIPNLGHSIDTRGIEIAQKFLKSL